MMPEPRDRFDELLRDTFKAGVPDPEFKADDALPEEVPVGLRASIIEVARQFSTRLLAHRLCAAGEGVGWGIEDLASEASGCEGEAKRFLRGEGTPLELEPGHIAKMFFRARFEPNQWATLLFQAVASQAVYSEPSRGQIWGRTSGLSDLLRAERLSGSKPQPRDPAWAERFARAFVDEVLDEWKRLTTGMS